MAETRVSEWERWLVVAGGLLVQLCLGSIYAYSVFSNPVSNQFEFGDLPGGKDIWVLMPFGVELLFFALTTIASGRLQDKFGPMLISLIGGVLLGAGMILSGLVVMFDQPYWLFILTYGVLGGIGIGFGYVCPIAALVKWFPDKKGMISGIAVAGFGFGAFIVGKVATWLMTREMDSKVLDKLTDGAVSAAEKNEIYSSFNLEYALIILGAAYLGLVLAGGFLLKNPPKDYKPAGWSPPTTASGGKRKEFDWQDMIKTPQFWMLWGSFLMAAAAGLLVIGNVGGFAKELDIQPDDIAWIVGALAILNALGRVAWGFVSDKIGRTKTMMIMWAVQAAAMFGLFFAGKVHWGLLMLDAAAVGFCFGGNFAMFPATTADLFGTKNIGLNYGIVFTSYGVAGIGGAFLAGIIVDQIGGEKAYMIVFIVMAALSIAPAAVAYLLSRMPLDDGGGDERDRSQMKARPKKKKGRK